MTRTTGCAPPSCSSSTGSTRTSDAARAALDGVGTTIAETYVGSKLTRDEALAKRLLLFVGKSATMKVGRLIPGFAIAFNAVSNRRDTNRLARRAIKFYGGLDGQDGAVDGRGVVRAQERDHVRDPLRRHELVAL